MSSQSGLFSIMANCSKIGAVVLVQILFGFRPLLSGQRLVLLHSDDKLR